MKSIIFSGAYIENYDYLSEINFDEYLIICADSGYKHAENLKIVPDVILPKTSFLTNRNTPTIEAITSKQRN